MDALALPALGATILCFVIVVWTTWLGDKSKRALVVSEEDDVDGEERPADAER